jgi:hypothetical protein
VVAVQEAGMAHLRAIDDCTVLGHAAQDQRAVVTDNVPDFLRCHHRRLEASQMHFGLLFFSNRAYPRHRHDLFVGRIVAALDEELRAHPHDDGSAWIRWLP